MADYVSLISTHYGVRIKALDYMRASEAARRQINAWVEDKTGARIKELIQPGVLGETTRLVLANAIYFKGLWMSPFEKDNTKDAAFNIAAGQTVQTPMMTEKVKCRYASLPACDLLELPYQGKGMAMTVLLPKEVDGIAKLERELTAENVAHWSNELTEQEVLVSLPRFKMTSAFRLEKPLSALGMVDAFHEGKANFAGMDGRADGLYIGAVIHKAFVEVNEEGTEAAAATAVAMLRKSAMPMRTPVFRADHPFVYLIQERSTGSILFMGKLVDPSKAQ